MQKNGWTKESKPIGGQPIPMYYIIIFSWGNFDTVERGEKESKISWKVHDRTI
jgi:hypothetical protein